MKKQFILIVILAMTASILGACKSEVKSSIKAENLTSNPSVVEVKLAETVTIPSVPASQILDKTTGLIVETSVRENPTPVERQTSEGATSEVTEKTSPSQPETAADLAHPTRPATGGELPMPYTDRMSKVPGVFVDKTILNEVDAWFKQAWEEKLLDVGTRSVYDFVQKFKISEAYFKEKNSGLMDTAFTDEEISDIYTLSRKAFIDKYASPFVLVKNENVYQLAHLAKLSMSDWKTLGISKDDVISQLKKAREANPELADVYELSFGEKLK